MIQRSKPKKISVTNSKASTQNTNNLSKQQSKSDKPSKSSFSHPTSHHGNSKLGQSGTNVRSNVNANQSLPTFQPKPLTKQDLIQHQHLQRQEQMKMQQRQAKIRSWMQERG